MLAEGSMECCWASCQTYNNAPVWGMLLAAGFGAEPLRAPNVIGAAVSLRGWDSFWVGALKGGGISVVGDVLALIAAVSFGAYSVLSRAHQRHYSPLNIATYSTLSGGLTLFLLTLAELTGGHKRSFLEHSSPPFHISCFTLIKLFQNSYQN
jgi:drug/metabolite transporter (DMT)-like permease